MNWTTALTGVDLADVMGGITDLIPIILPVVVGFIALRKGLAFLKSQLKSA